MPRKVRANRRSLRLQCSASAAVLAALAVMASGCFMDLMDPGVRFLLTADAVPDGLHHCDPTIDQMAQGVMLNPGPVPARGFTTIAPETVGFDPPKEAWFQGFATKEGDKCEPSRGSSWAVRVVLLRWDIETEHIDAAYHLKTNCEQGHVRIHDGLILMVAGVPTHSDHENQTARTIAALDVQNTQFQTVC